MFAKETILVLRVAVLFICSASSLNAVPVANVTEEPVTTTTSSPKIETGFVPSAPLEANSTESVNKRAGRYTNNHQLPVRKFDKNSNGGDSAVPGDYPVSAVINHYHGDLENNSVQAINYYPAVQPEDARLEKPPRLYYGDYARRPTPPAPQDELDYMEADDGKGNEAEKPQYYYPQNLPSKQGYEHGSGSKRGRPHGHSSNTYNSYTDHQAEDQANQPGQTQLHGAISVSAGVDAHPFPHHHHNHHHPHHAVLPHHGYRDYGHQHNGQYYHANPIGPVIGRALQLLIPSALLFTGASALFPNRIHVPTNDAPAQQRSRRSVPVDRSYNYDARSAFDDIPSQYLRPEHRSDDEGIPLYDDDDDIFEPSSSASFGERTPEGTSFATPMPTTTTSQSIDTTPSVPTTSIPIIKANKLVPAEDIEAEEYETEQQDIKKLNASSPLKNNTESRTSPMEVMSKILMASVSSADISALKKPVAAASTNSTTTSYSSVVPQVRRYDTSITNEKPFFRQLSSTHAPRIVIVTPLTNSVREDDSAKIVQRREVEQDKSTAVDLSSGPPIVTLGGESEGNNGTLALNRTEGTNEISDDLPDIDLSPDSPVVGLLTNYAAREEETPACQKRALCELAMRGSKEGATKFERFLWNLANLVPPSLSVYYDLQDTFSAIQHKKCASFVCANPNLDLQDPSSQ